MQKQVKKVLEKLNWLARTDNAERVYFIVNRFQISRMRTIVHTIDPKAFMTITEVADVFTSV